MSIQLHYYEPAEYAAGQKQIIVAPFQWNATHENTGPRLQYVADKVGRLVVGMSALSAIEPGDDFAHACGRLADLVKHHRDEAELIGWGDSLAGQFIAGMQHHNKGFFERVLFRDSVNLTGPQKSLRGYQYVLGYQARDFWHQMRLKRAGQAEEPVLIPTVEIDKHRSTTAGIANAFREMHIVSKLMRSRTSVDLAYLLADDPNLALRFVGFSHGMSGPRALVEEFVDNMEARRAVALGRFTPIRNINATVEPGWHSDLTKASLAHRHVEETLALPLAT